MSRVSEGLFVALACNQRRTQRLNFIGVRIVCILSMDDEIHREARKLRVTSQIHEPCFSACPIKPSHDVENTDYTVHACQRLRVQTHAKFAPSSGNIAAMRSACSRSGLDSLALA